MSDDTNLVFETELEASLEKVWRALSIPEYRDRWLDKPDNVLVEVVGANDSNLLTLRWQERNEVSFVTIELQPGGQGGTWFRLTHAPPAANSNHAPSALMLAA
ncbi:MAG: SRPBCC domain-containing protein [Devosia sp.]|uniref:SRPBCC domain-containing protein n=1 Tax=Devosia sp. TaxID=1871048 RepID=UPI0024C74E8F|nr:SRPBCC domain-containing protein [Devosia sp.]UYO00634.1 MAG: SRPBCC domain-containing protein [Devosia sp.]